MSLELKSGIVRKFRGGDAGVAIPDGTQAIDEYAFYKTDVHHVLIPGSIAVIGVRAFAGCKRLASIEIPDSVSVIGSDAFSHCKNLLSAKVDAILIQDRAFTGCLDLRRVTLSSRVRAIGSEAFYKCGCLESIVIPDSVTQIGDRAFAGCGRLRTVILGKGVKQIGRQAFAGCAPETLAVDPDNPYFYSDGAVLRRRTNIPEEQDSPFIIENGTLTVYAGADRTIHIPPTVNRIGVGAFYHNPGPVYMNIHDGVTSIGALAFCGCKHLQFINYTDSVTCIGRRAFAQCHRIKSISLPASLRANWEEYVERA